MPELALTAFLQAHLARCPLGTPGKHREAEVAPGDCLVSCWQVAEEMEIGRTGPLLCVPALPRGSPSFKKHLCSLFVHSPLACHWEPRGEGEGLQL